jgi:phenylpropionate dioxygenase-like ring-hydroxylating dioxygenase large terminal subunit
MTLEIKTLDAAQWAATQPQPEPESAFNWRNCWYPVTFIQDLPENRPYSFSLYDEPFVLFRDGQGQLVCLIDRCPHRAAKLSDGQIIEGKLECLYHGWQFGNEGQCLHIPQLPTDAKIPVNACIKSFQVVERQGMIWVWAGDVQAANEESIPTLDILDRPDVGKFDYMADMPYDHTYLVENFVDPAHVFISHDRTEAGAHRENAQPLEMEIIESSIAGFRGRYRGMRKPNAPWQGLDFQAPNFVHYTINVGNPALMFGLALYAVPLGKGRSRAFVRRYRNFSTWPFKYKPLWIEHLRQSKVLEEDMFFIRGQEAEIERLGQTLKQTYLPLKTSDLLVLEYRKWVDRYGQSLPFYDGYSTFKRTSDQVGCHSTSVALDRFSRHTQFCSSCHRTYQTTIRLKQVLVGVAITIAGLTIAIDPPATQRWIAIFMILMMIASAVVAHTVRTKFERSYERQ